MGKGKMVLITDADVEKLKFVKDAAKTMTAAAKWCGCSTIAFRTWLSAETTEGVRWFESSKMSIYKVARDLDPKPRVPVFSNRVEIYDRVLDLAISMRGQEGELEVLRLAVDIAKEQR